MVSKKVKYLKPEATKAKFSPFLYPLSDKCKVCQHTKGKADVMLVANGWVHDYCRSEYSWFNKYGFSEPIP